MWLGLGAIINDFRTKVAAALLVNRAERALHVGTSSPTNPDWRKWGITAH